MPQDDLDRIPSIIPTREGVSAGGAGGGKARRRADKQGGSAPKQKSGAGILARLFILVALVAAAVACAWAWQLQAELLAAEVKQQDYERRISDLEARLSDTDEGMNQNAEVQAAKLRELDSEVRKLWDNVWKKAGARLDALEASSGTYKKSISSLQGAITTAEEGLESTAADITRLNSIAGDMSRLMASAKASQEEVERVADTLNRINLDLAKLNKRVSTNEEWVASINAFRRQINASLAELQGGQNNATQTPGATP